MGRFPVAQGAALGDRGPKKGWFLGLKGRFQGVCCFRVRARGFQTLTHVALPKRVLQASGRRTRVWFVPCPRLRFRPETSISGSPGRSHRHDPFCRCHGSKDCSAPPTPNGPTATHNLAAGNVQGTRIRAPEAVPEFTANAFADHHRRMRLASNCEPKTMDSLRCSGGMPSTTPHVVGNDKASARAQTSRHPWNPQCVSRGWSRAGMTRGTKVGWGCEPVFLRLKNAAFWGWWGA
ncbi:MAG: hypothetical protein RIT02_2383 [Planctomycetota bacterium]